MHLRRVPAILLGIVGVIAGFTSNPLCAQDAPPADQLEQLLAPIALYPDTLLAQICAASGDPQQIIDTNTWVKANAGLQGAALTDAAQAQGFDPAFVALVSFPSVLDAMANHIDDYAALGDAFKANQPAVMQAIQSLRQQAYASGALDTNQYQKVSVQKDNGAQVVIIQPANPQVVYVPEYEPTQVFVESPDASNLVVASVLSFGAGIAIGALINDQPWGWRRWGWGWGGRGMLYRNSTWGFAYRYRSPRPYYRPRPPLYNRPIHARPPPNWSHRPGYRPRPSGPGSGRPPGQGHGIRPPHQGGGRPPGNSGGSRPPSQGSSGRPPRLPGRRPPGNGETRPAGNGSASRPSPGSDGGRPPGRRDGAKPLATHAPRPVHGATARPAPMPRPVKQNPYAGFPQPTSRVPAQGVPSRQQRPPPPARRPAAPSVSGARPGAFGGNANGNAARAASNRGRASSGAPPQGRRR